MIKYYVQDGVIVINKYAVKYRMVQNSGKVETVSDIIQYFSDEKEINGLITELQTKGIEFEFIELDIKDIIKYNGVYVNSNEEARKIIEPKIEEIIGNKIEEISEKCKNTIYEGIDVVLTNGQIKHFSLTIEDQLNLNNIMSQISIGNIKPEDGILYHADGEMCKLFSIDDFNIIFSKASEYILSQITYTNHLMAYIKSLKTRKEIEDINYGDELSGDIFESYEKLIETINC